MRSLPEALADAARCGPGSVVFHLADEPVRLGIDELAARAGVAGSWLADRGVGRGDRIGLLGPNRPEWAVWAFGIWSAGAALVPLQLPLRVRDRSAFADRVEAIARAGGCRLVVADPALKDAVPADLTVPWDEPPGATDHGLDPPGPADPAVIQFTSGSTAAPKGALLTHEAVLAQVRALGGRVVHPAETMVSWAPFFHDMGLFLCLVAPALLGCASHILPTERFARDPAEWLRLVGLTRATYTAGPQSAWAAAVKAAERRREPIDLRSLEAAMFAAEAVDPAFVREIQAWGAGAGLSEGALATSFGLAEAVLAVTTSLRGEGIAMHEIDREALSVDRVAREPVGEAKRIAGAGVPLPGTALRIVRDGAILDDRAEGEVQVRSVSRMSGYVGTTGSDPFDGDWLCTGDLGYLHEDQLYVTGRSKDVLIVLGHNYYPEDFEWAATRTAGVRPGRCAAFLDASGERIVLLVEPSDGAHAGSLARAVRHSVTDAVGTAPGLVAVVGQGTIEKTSSGKLRRATMRSAFQHGQIELHDQS